MNIIRQIPGVLGCIVLVYYGIRVLVTACDPRVWWLMREDPWMFFQAAARLIFGRFIRTRQAQDMEPEDSEE